ncbi:hypothetical protein [Halobacillus ihumii]|uniref:hypothetical protein n=1 Tax=Halobacillus ihumii TaxID=2686092 RepID=UPI0013D6AEED|nr:hypothetical protein [Halobacillus ihumii]
MIAVIYFVAAALWIFNTIAYAVFDVELSPISRIFAYLVTAWAFFIFGLNELKNEKYD